MTADIVERLRDGEHCTVGCAKLRAEAAAEIKRFRALRQDDGAVIAKLQAVNKQLTVENQRLRAGQDWQRAENARLRKEK